MLTLAICFIFKKAAKLRPCPETPPPKKNFGFQVQAICGYMLLFVVGVAFLNPNGNLMREWL